MGNSIKTELRTEMRKSLPADWKPDLVRLARQLPYEQKRKKLQKLDLTRQIEANLYQNDNSKYIVASGENKPVGLLKIDPAPLHSNILGEKIYRAGWELIKDNENYIRRSIFKKLREKFENNRVNFQQPRANRQACALLANLPYFHKCSEEIILYDRLAGKPEINSLPANQFKCIPPGELKTNDLHRLLENYNQGHLFDYPGYSEDKIKEIYRLWLDETRKKQNPREVAVRSENRLAGYCLVKEVNSSFINVKSGSVTFIQVHPQDRGQGLGSWLLGKGLQLLNQNNVEYVEIKTSRKNKTAINFYHKFGFETISRRIHFSLLPGC